MTHIPGKPAQFPASPPPSDEDTLDSLATLAAGRTGGGKQPPSPKKVSMASQRLPAVVTASKPLMLTRGISGFMLIVAFFLPWIQVSCNQNTLSRPSALNLVTGIPDAHTKGYLRMLDGPSLLASPEGQWKAADNFSFWRFGNGKVAPEIMMAGTNGPSDKEYNSASSIDDMWRIVGRVSLYGYSLFLLPLIVLIAMVESVILVLSKPGRSPRGVEYFSYLHGVLGLAGAIFLGIFAYAVMPSEIPPIARFSLDWGWYLSFLACLTIPFVMAVGIFQSERVTNT